MEKVILNWEKQSENIIKISFTFSVLTYWIPSNSSEVSYYLVMGRVCKFSPSITKRVIKAMDRVCQHPCAHPFFYPMEHVYLQFIHEDMCLSQIRSKILLNEYITLSEWRRDMMLIFQNIETIWGSSSLQYILVTNMIEIFNKEFSSINAFSITRWSKKYNSLLLKLQQEYDKMPNIFKSQSIIAATLQQITINTSIPKVSMKNYAIHNPPRCLSSMRSKECISSYLPSPIEPLFSSVSSPDLMNEEDLLNENDFFRAMNPFFFDPKMEETKKEYEKNIFESNNVEMKKSIKFDMSSQINKEMEMLPKDGGFTLRPSTIKKIANSENKTSQQQQSRIFKSDNDYQLRNQSSISKKKQKTRKKYQTKKLKQNDDDYHDDVDYNYTSNNHQKVEVNDQTISKFMIDSTFLMNSDDILHMASIIHKYEPQIDLSSNQPEINMKKLRKITIQALITYTKTHITERKQ
ncbi:hypothetical protein TRFO_33498 [Tritrichomonas foetus]|uniref:Bromo domain-containing protein n=1 Tax=Tritrichomonas foetus TaxID=1144522 RepID=A0A1J4JLJ8_9EUKA|nr:hypothetical protein TRFO_33498 [Tritrichomonas foetus]|eukprot:OHS99974.1 hypothetical protein TRFO_33498 [Tritrichomonas foetus]